MEVLCSSEQLQSCLASWLSALDSYRGKLLDPISTMDDQSVEDPSKDDITERGPPSVLAPPPPFSALTPTVASSVIHLTSLCVELAVYGGQPEAADSQCGRSLDEFIAVYVELLDWSRVRCLLAQQQWSLREKGWWALIKGGM